MARSFLIIDGYNLMHAAGMARERYGPGDLERCRNRFLRYLSRRLTASERNRTTIVFDALDAPPGLSRHASIGHMDVVFARRGGDADTLIEQLVTQHSAPRQVCVVSSDHRLQKAARRRRGQSVDSETFVAQLERRNHGGGSSSSSSSSSPETPVPEKLTGPVDPKETEHWLEVFGDIPEAAELQSDAERLEREVADMEETDGDPDELDLDDLDDWMGDVEKL